MDTPFKSSRPNSEDGNSRTLEIADLIPVNDVSDLEYEGHITELLTATFKAIAPIQTDAEIHAEIFGNGGVR